MTSELERDISFEAFVRSMDPQNRCIHKECPICQQIEETRRIQQMKPLPNVPEHALTAYKEGK